MNAERPISELLPEGWRVRLNETGTTHALMRDGHAYGHVERVKDEWHLLLDDEDAAKGLAEHLTAVGIAATMALGSSGCTIRLGHGPVGPPYQPADQIPMAPPIAAVIVSGNEAPAAAPAEALAEVELTQAPKAKPGRGLWSSVDVPPEVLKEAVPKAKGSRPVLDRTLDVRELLKEKWPMSDFYQSSRRVLPVSPEAFGSSVWQRAAKQVIERGHFDRALALPVTDTRYHYLIAMEKYGEAMTALKLANNEEGGEAKAAASKKAMRLYVLAKKSFEKLANKPVEARPKTVAEAERRLEERRRNGTYYDGDLKWASKVALNLLEIPNLPGDKQRLATWRQELDSNLKNFQEIAFVQPSDMLRINALARAWAGTLPVAASASASEADRLFVALVRVLSFSATGPKDEESLPKALNTIANAP